MHERIMAGLDSAEDVGLPMDPNEMCGSTISVGGRKLTVVRHEVHSPHLDQIEGPSPNTRSRYRWPLEDGAQLVQH